MKKEKLVQINQIQGYENIKDCYWISNNDEDKIINKNTGKIMKILLDKGGYKRVNLMTIDGKVKTCRIHVIKAKAFLYTPNPISYNVIRHLNDVKTDNRLINLAWGTRSANTMDSIRNGSFNYKAVVKNSAKGRVIGGTTTAKKYSKPVKCLDTGIIYASAKEAERKLGISNSSINHCCSGKRKAAKGLHFEFVDKEVNDDDMECKQIR